MLVAEEVATGNIVGAVIIRMWKRQRNGEFVIISIHADYQQHGIGRDLYRACDQHFEHCGVEMAFVMLATEHTVTQQLCIEEGDLHVIGIFHGYYRVWAGKDNLARRANCVLAQKFYGGAEKMCPTDMQLLPEAQELHVPLDKHYHNKKLKETILMNRDKLNTFLKVLAQGIPNCQTTAIFFADKQSDDTYLSCYQDYVDGIPSTKAQFQKQPLNQFTWFMPQVYATQKVTPDQRLVISDYALIPDTAPLKKYYPPAFISVVDYVLWDDNNKFIGWIGILSTKDPIAWATYHNFIVKTITDYQQILLAAYTEDFLKS